MDLTTATPVEIDTMRADLDGELAHAYGMFDRAQATIHASAGDRPRRNQGYALSHETALAQAKDKLANGKLLTLERDTLERALAGLAKANADIDSINARIAPLDDEYRRRPWSRFIAVQDGHLHSGTRCAGGTIRATTRLAWNPQLSGKTEAEAVAELGPMLCTHCFPSAPVEFTMGKPKAPRCEGAGLPPVHGSVKRVRMSVYGRCTGCDVVKPLTQYGYLRAHPPVKA